MGAYSARPVTKCESTDDEQKYVRYGASSMQGWRRSQEDAHNTILDFDDTPAMLFAVYDGHGGAEVAKYCQLHLPDYIKKMPEYEKGDVEAALKEAFIKFDAHLLEEGPLKELRELANRSTSPAEGYLGNIARQAALQKDSDDEDDDVDDDDSNPGDCEEDETAALLEEAGIPVEQVLQRLTGGQPHSAEQFNGSAEDTSETEKGAGDATAKDNGTAKHKPSASGALGSGASGSGASGSGASESGASGSGASGSGASGSGASNSKAEATEGNSEEESEDDGDYPDGEVEGEDSEEEGEEESEDEEEMKRSHELALKFTESEDYIESPGSDSGCTACLALIHSRTVYVANAGDSRCVLSRGGKAVELSVDHKPEDELEKERIEKAGGFITPDGRVNGNLNLSRALGDHNYKRNKSLSLGDQMISARPDIVSARLGHEDEFLIIACDGIWNSVTSQQCVDFVAERLANAEKLSQICEDMFHGVLADDTMEGDGTGCDNMTMIIVDLKGATRVKAERTDSTGFDHTQSDSTEDPAPKKAKLDG